ncbi:MAG: carbonic anhydrase [Methylocella sp.]
MRSDLKLLLEYKDWAEEQKLREPDYFQRLAADQKPQFLWIGCSDSRVPADTIVNAAPGAIFTHRNIANQVIATAFNCLSVIQFAVEVLKVQHIIVCGHYNCCGVRASLDRHRPELALIANRLIELNVIEQVRRLSHFAIVQSAWKNDQRPTLHGWVFALEDGILRQLITLPPRQRHRPNASAIWPRGRIGGLVIATRIVPRRRRAC